MAPLNILYLHSICVLKLLTSNAFSAILCRFMNNYTHLLMSSQLLTSYYQYMYRLRKELHCYPRLSKPICGGEEKWPTQCQPSALYSQAQKQPCYLSLVLTLDHLPVPPFPLVQNPSLKDIARSNITS